MEEHLLPGPGAYTSSGSACSHYPWTPRSMSWDTLLSSSSLVSGVPSPPWCLGSPILGEELVYSLFRRISQQGSSALCLPLGYLVHCLLKLFQELIFMATVERIHLQAAHCSSYLLHLVSLLTFACQYLLRGYADIFYSISISSIFFLAVLGKTPSLFHK